ncbi:EAL domain-containing protein [Caenibius sp. WL]|uniref:putative bifunctional diguanylate cyclase/phosphodiesterase n=1 Tax=Caenibius sp. WL TaxID=2872646 RepID=UPI001C9A1FDC|nr:EAL domain-containing protein [Caenibius sp. WL]
MGNDLSERQPLPADLPAELSLAALLGLRDTPGGAWARLRGLQYSYLARIARRRLVVHGIAGAAILFMFSGVVPAWMIASWAAALIAMLCWTLHSDRQLGDTDRRPITRGEIWRHTLLSAAVATLWSVPILVFTGYGAPGDIFAVWGVQAMLLAAAALWLAPVPLGAGAVILILGFSAIAALGAGRHFEMMGIATSFMVMTLAGAVKGARNYLTARIAEAGVAEKNEVVSLLLREFEETGANWLWKIDASRRVRGVSVGFADALAGASHEMEGKPFLQLIAGMTWETGEFEPGVRDLADRLQGRESFSNLIVPVEIGNRRKWWELSGTPRFDHAGRFIGFRGVGSDVTEERESSEKIAYLARFDTLTNLPNRMMLTEALDAAIQHAEKWSTRCAFLMIDLDRFKQINDTLGHQVGDRLLTQVAGRLKSLMNASELCGRLGGDEFAIVIRDACDMRRVREVAEAVIRLLSPPYEVDSHLLYIGASVGSAVGLRDGRTVEALMHNADLALYRAKAGGGGRHVSFEPSLRHDAERRRKMEQALRHALERDEFHLHYQPMVDAHGEQLIGFEALLRWNSPECGAVAPAKFIPVAEDTRLIVPIGEWVLREACREAMHWPGHVKIAVNVSGEQLLAPDFMGTVVRALTDCGLPPQRLEIDVTESVFVRDDAMARAVLDDVLALGCGVALDDFGTGSSSLDHLRRLRFSTIKIDRNFAKGAVAGDPQSLAIIRAVVAMAGSLGIATTVEGVENVTEARLIRALGCDAIQGDYCSKPMAATDARNLFAVRPAPGLRA